MPSSVPAASHRFSLGLMVAGTLTGLLLTLGFLGSDSAGRVNLLALLFLFVAVPLLTLVASGVFLLRGRGRGLAGWLLGLPLWPPGLRLAVLPLADGPRGHLWLVYQGQVLGLGFGAGSLLALIWLLLISDVSFVWRSTLLTPDALLPPLEILAVPWRFWTAAQPTAELLRASQEYRLAEVTTAVPVLGQWWRYAVAALGTYTVLPRLLMLVITGVLWRRSLRHAVQTPQAGHVPLNMVPAPGALAPVIPRPPVSARLVNWDGLPPACLSALRESSGAPLPELAVTDWSTHSDSQMTPVVVVVKAWEPPLGSLLDAVRASADHGTTGSGLLPVDWEDEGLQPLRENHLAEWRRFAATLGGWSVVNLETGP